MEIAQLQSLTGFFQGPVRERKGTETRELTLVTFIICSYIRYCIDLFSLFEGCAAHVLLWRLTEALDNLVWRTQLSNQLGQRACLKVKIPPLYPISSNSSVDLTQTHSWLAEPFLAHATPSRLKVRPYSLREHWSSWCQQQQQSSLGC